MQLCDARGKADSERMQSMAALQEKVDRNSVLTTEKASALQRALHAEATLKACSAERGETSLACRALLSYVNWLGV